MTNKESKISNRAKMQTLISQNTSMAAGDFHTDQLDVNSLVMDIKKHFNISTKDNRSDGVVISKLVKSSTSRLRGRTSAKEFNQKKFLKLFFESFEIERV